MLVLVVVLDLTVYFSEQPGTAPNSVSVSNFRAPGLALSDLNVAKIASWTFESAGPNDFEDEDDDEDEYDWWRGAYPPRALRIFPPSGLPRPVVGSQPGPALKAPLFPETISWNADGF